MEGNWNPNISWDVHNPDIANLLDDKTAANIRSDLKRALPPGGFPSKF
jgi:hypothetical protein